MNWSVATTTIKHLCFSGVKPASTKPTKETQLKKFWTFAAAAALTVAPLSVGTAANAADAYPQINVSSPTYTPGSVETVKGSNFPANTSVPVKLSNNTVVTPKTDASGQFTTTFTLAANAALGNQKITATAAGKTAEWVINVQAFNVWAAPSSYYLLGGKPISFAGYRYLPGEKVNVFYNGVSVASGTANSTGDFTTNTIAFSFPSMQPGTVKTFTLTGATSKASTSVNVTVAYANS